MKTGYIVSICSIAIFWPVLAYAKIEPSGKDAPPNIVQRAKELAGKKDYAGLEEMVSEVDAKFGSDHSPDYFRSLLGIKSAVSGYSYPTRAEFARFWLIRKLRWKILLTPYSHPKDALEVQETKRLIADFLSPIPWRNFDGDKDQFLAMRQDAVAMLFAYGDSLRSRIIPGYRRKPEREMGSFNIDDPAAMAAYLAKRKSEEAQLIQNEYENHEQDELRECLRVLAYEATSLIKHDFSWPPEDDETVEKILTAFPSDREPKEKILSDLANMRQRHLRELAEEAARRTGAVKTP